MKLTSRKSGTDHVFFSPGSEKRGLSLLWFFLGLFAFSPLQAQTYPSRPVKLVVPFPAGSATDHVARLTGSQLQEALGQPFIVENKPGAQGGIAAAEVARAAPDGLTLLVTTNTPQAANVSLFKKLNYDPVRDFAPIARLGTTSFMLMVRPEFPAKDLKEFLAHVRKQPGKLSAGYGSAGSQVSLAMLQSMAKLDVVEVGYKGIPQAITDVMGGSIAFTFVDLGNAISQAKGGKLRGLAVTSPKRTSLAADVPAIAEELKGYELIAWFGLVAPAKTPKDIVQKLHDATVKGLAKPEVREKFAAIGTDVAPLGPSEFGKFIQSEIEHWRKLVKLANIQPE
jgi:tripartite-type tricarboxylate transporter receptor subunit TctC